ncbi:discoidin domain-containing protein [Lederbergia sp. NSJ-179]|uniref:discoidin domain-containing protein n=1 Tax=Lederbergia sp. NSJ-179 TaxID=2931402 RepID=UPI001FD4E726|nr:discoidin domain-containing protein [Lederbergia sp. NSJ-179]MCJ7842141.1 discoidin domain-containing protein [Lederbergia sp. NSJ-179]
MTDEIESLHADGDNPGRGEIDANLIDRNHETKWLSHKNTAKITMKLLQPEAVTNYAFTSANDFPGRDPQNWTLYGSNDGENWTKLDVQSGVKFEERFQRKTFSFKNDEKYVYYQFDITKNSGESGTQLAEIALSNWVEHSPPSSSVDMIVSVQRFEEEGAFADSKAVHALRVHLTAVQRFEEKDSVEKVVKHLNGFKQLLRHQRDDELISENAYNSLLADADFLIEKYQ